MQKLSRVPNPHGIRLVSPPLARSAPPDNALRYWKAQAERYERLAVYSWGGWMIVTGVLLIVLIVEQSRP